MKKSVAVLLVRDSEYVMQHRDNTPAIAYPDTYSTWGGEKLPGDASDMASAIRELAEETGIACEETGLQDLGFAKIADNAPDNTSGRMIEHFFALEINPDQEVECFEGQAAVGIPRPHRPNPKVNLVAREAIARYEAAA